MADTIRHGTTSAYTNQMCRCAECREAWRVYHAPGGKGYTRMLRYRDKLTAMGFYRDGSGRKRTDG